MIETQPSSSLASTPETHSDGGITGDRLEDGGSTAEGFFKELRAVSSTEHTSVVRTFETCRRTLRMSAYRGWSQPVDATLYLNGEMECTLMGHRFHRGFTAAEKTELWDRWKRGESLKAIGRAFGKQSSSIYFLVAPHGGIRPAERRRSRLALTLAEREVISRGVTAHQSARSIARLLGRSPSTVSREMSRNGWL